MNLRTVAFWTVGFVVSFAFVVWAIGPIVAELVGAYR